MRCSVEINTASKVCFAMAEQGDRIRSRSRSRSRPTSAYSDYSESLSRFGSRFHVDEPLITLDYPIEKRNVHCQTDTLKWHAVQLDHVKSILKDVIKAEPIRVKEHTVRIEQPKVSSTSVPISENAMIKLLEERDDILDRIESYHIKNSGITWMHAKLIIIIGLIIGLYLLIAFVITF